MSVIVIGGGAAGIVAAWRAAQLGAKVTLLEKTERLGTKILISGGGKCNITHDGPIEEVLKAFRSNEARFIRPACYRFKNTDVLELLTSRGLRVYTRPDGRIFPVDQTAKDVVRILSSHLADVGVDTRLKQRVDDLRVDGDSRWIVNVGETDYRSDAVIVTTGGSSYPKSGTTGDGWPWAKRLGHSIRPVRAALAPIDLDDTQRFTPGVALRDVILKARIPGKELARWRGDLLFTHHGVSGPCALGISREIAETPPNKVVSLEIDLEPDLTFEQLQARSFELARNNATKKVSVLLSQRLTESLQSPFLRDVSIDPQSICHSLSKKAINILVESTKSWKIGQVSSVPLSKGEVVAGGISLDEVDPQTMASLVVKGLYFAGEILDVAGPVGGYNLQAAFATGFVAGESVAKKS